MRSGMMKWAALVCLLWGACSSAETPPATDSPTPTPTISTLKGFVVAPYVMLHGDCKKVYDPAYGTDGNSADSIFAAFQQATSRKTIEKAAAKEVTVRDGSGSSIATATTADDAKFVLSQSGKEFDNCFALYEYETQLPPADSYLFAVEGLGGSVPPVSQSQLEGLDFQCDLHLDEKAALVSRFGCDDVGLDP